MTAQRVTPTWLDPLPLQQQSVVILALRGPDGVRKYHPCKRVVRCYRGTVLCAAKYGRWLEKGEAADDFMNMSELLDPHVWQQCIKDYFRDVDELPLHYHMHLLHGAQVIAYKHPDPEISKPWMQFYDKGCEDLHLTLETVVEMDRRLNDWNRMYWGQ